MKFESYALYVLADLIDLCLLDSIQPQHAVVTNKKGAVTLKPESGAKLLVNGQVIKSEATLHHNDRYISIVFCVLLLL